MTRRYIPCRYTYLKHSSCEKLKNMDKETVQNKYSLGSRAELLSNKFKRASLISDTKIKIFNVNQKVDLYIKV